jgi:type VI secretion system protein
MAIKLRVISEQYRELGDSRSRVFGVNGGSVGRALDNDWVLPDPKRVVSGHHFEVQYQGGAYWLRDLSTNGVYVNDSEDPASRQGRVELRDGDRLRVGPYEILVSVDSRIDFLPAAGEEDSAIKHMDSDIGHNLDLGSLLRPRDHDESGSIPVRNAYGIRVSPETRESLLESLQRAAGDAALPPPPPVARVYREPTPPPPPPPAQTLPVTVTATATAAPHSSSPDWAMRTRPINREELADALARRQSRGEAKDRSIPFHQQATTWQDLKSALQAFCRGAGIDVASLSPEAQSMLPLIAGQLLREAVVGLNDIAQARSASGIGPRVPGAGGGGASNPLRSSTSVEQAMLRLFESHGRVFGGPVESLRDVMQEAKDHEAATLLAMREALRTVLDQLSPSSVADQFEQGRARTLAPGQDPRPKYWEHYADFYRLLTQQGSHEELPHAFVEVFGKEYARARAQLRDKKSGQ